MNPRTLLGIACLASCGCLAGPSAALDSDKPPGANFDLTHWKLTLPVDSLGGTQGVASEIPAARLTAGYTNPLFFRTGHEGEMVFRCPASGARTPGAAHPRTELREMLDPQTVRSNWTGDGIHILEAQCRATGVARGCRVAIGQVHGFSTDIPLVILRYDNRRGLGTITATVKYNTRGERVAGKTDEALVFADVGPEKPIDYRILVSNGVVCITVNGSTQSRNFYATDPGWKKVTFYFKAGDYYVDNGGTDQPAQVSFYSLTSRHLSFLSSPQSRRGPAEPEQGLPPGGQRFTAIERNGFLSDRKSRNRIE